MARVYCPRELLWIGVLTLVFQSRLCDPEPDKGDTPRKNSHNIGIVHFNNPKLLPSDAEVDDSRYVFDTSQEDVDPRRMGGIHIREEARKLAFKFNKLSNEEIGVTAMQVCMSVYYQSSYIHRRMSYLQPTACVFLIVTWCD